MLTLLAGFPSPDLRRAVGWGASRADGYPGSPARPDVQNAIFLPSLRLLRVAGPRGMRRRRLIQKKPTFPQQK